MKFRAGHAMGRTLLLMVLASSLRGQAPAGSSAAGGSSAPDAPTKPAVTDSKAHDANFVIGNDDVLGISVWKETDLTRSIPVRSDGKISLPLVGELQAAGKTPLELEQDITLKLKAYITEPEVTVMVEQINSEKFNILGQVAKPGSYSLTLATTVMDAIATAGGFRDFAKQKGIYILRRSAGGAETKIAFNYKDFIKGKNPEQNIKLEPHDTVVVP
jgi:polysaccharide export outer membrane protein